MTMARFTMYVMLGGVKSSIPVDTDSRESNDVGVGVAGVSRGSNDVGVQVAGGRGSNDVGTGVTGGQVLESC